MTTSPTQPKIKSFAFKITIDPRPEKVGGNEYVVDFYGQYDGQQLHAGTKVRSKLQALDLVRQLYHLGHYAPHYFSIDPRSKEDMRNAILAATQLPDHGQTDLWFFSQDYDTGITKSLADSYEINFHNEIQES
jgi:hypothetical protein